MAGTQSALLEVRVLPWRPRTRVMDPDSFRQGLSPDVLGCADDLSGFVVGLVLGLALWVVLLVAAPVIVLVLAAAFLPVEITVVAALAVLLVVARFTGVIPWTVVVIDTLRGTETRERHRNLLRAVRRIRALNEEQRVLVRWAWA
jgi:hypothetical protein